MCKKGINICLKIEGTMDGEQILIVDRREFGLQLPDEGEAIRLALLATAKESIKTHEDILEAYIKKIADGRCHKGNADQKKKLALLQKNLEESYAWLLEITRKKTCF